MGKYKSEFKKRILWGVVLIIGVIILGLLFLPKDIQGDEYIAERGDIATYYSFSGNIEVSNRQTIFAEQALQVDEFKVEEGDVVEEGDTLYTTTMGEEVEVKIKGEVIDIFVEENEQIMPGAQIIEIADYDELELTVKVDEYDMVAIDEDKEVTVLIHALDEEVNGTVIDVSKEGIYANGATYFNATISIPKVEKLKVGMSAEAKVLKEEVKDAVILPMSAVSFGDDNNPYINVKNNRELEEIPVELGITDGVNVEVISGINEGEIAFVATYSFGEGLISKVSGGSK